MITINELWVMWIVRFECAQDDDLWNHQLYSETCLDWFEWLLNVYDSFEKRSNTALLGKQDTTELKRALIFNITETTIHFLLIFFWKLFWKGWHDKASTIKNCKNILDFPFTILWIFAVKRRNILCNNESHKTTYKAINNFVLLGSSNSVI